MIMKPIIEWTTPLPSTPSEEWIIESVLSAIDLPGVTDLRPLVHKIFIGCTFMNNGVKGVAYDSKDNPIIALHYSWSAGRGASCRFDDPQKAEWLDF
jgi:hypothetical protein